MYNNDQYDEVMNRLNATKPVVDRDPFIKAGQHDSLIVLSIETYKDQKWGQSVRGTFEVEKSSVHPVGSRCVKIWNLFKPSKFPTQATDADQFAQFLCILQGLPEGQHAASARAVLKSRAEGGNMESQPARGCRISATGLEVGNPNPTTGQRYVRVQWRNIPQDGNTITQTRAALDQRSPFTPAPQYAQQPQGYAQAQPAQMQQYAQQPQTFVQQTMQPAAQPAPLAQPVGMPAGGFLSLLPQK